MGEVFAIFLANGDPGFFPAGDAGQPPTGRCWPAEELLAARGRLAEAVAALRVERRVVASHP